ncbi:MAG: C40 family peptidase [Chloroflexi bacterium]|nr:C40 family peptidase [Chloroflexota bacterium]
MTTDIQNKLNDLASQYDKRVSVFDIEITALNGDTISLSGRVLNQSQLDDLHRFLPDLNLDTASINILERPGLPRLRVNTNLTGLYEKPTFYMPLSSELYYGTELEILEEKDRWAFTRQPDGYLGWAYKPYLTSESLPQETHIVIDPVIEARLDSSFNSGVVTRIVSGTGVTVKETRGKWSHVTAHRSGWVPNDALRAVNDLPRSTEARRNTLVEDSERMIGVPYLWGGTSGNGIDCSGFARLLHRWIGIDIPRDADMQSAAAKRVEPPFEIGDLFFFGEGDEDRHVTHVGISLGGWKMIHSSRMRNGVYIDDAQSEDYLRKIYMHAGSFLR